ncbi:MAG: GAF domain-containing protein [Beijerinckiaceae bacterium]
MKLEDAAALFAAPGQPQSLYKWLEDETKRLIGHKLFTLLYVDGAEVARIYSSNGKAYPVAGRKPMNQTAWAEVVLHGKRPWLGRTMAEIRWAFFDHELIQSLGCGACINVPVIYDAAVIGTMNILDAEGAYDETSVAKVSHLAPLLTPAFLVEARGG